MEISNESVKSLVKKASNGEINIPIFQRDFKWKPSQVRDFAESLYRKYPIGLILFWKLDMDITPKTTKSSNPYWIVDGQQRVSSLCILFGEKPYWWPSAKDWDEKKKKYEVMINLENEKIGLANPLRKKDPKWISIREILNVKEEKELKTIAKKLSKETSLDYADVIDILKGVFYIKKLYDVPILTIDHSLDEVVDIFARLNKMGTKVGEADIIKGLIASVNQDWLKNEFEKRLETWKSIGWNFDPIIILRTIAGIGKGKTILKEVKNYFWKDEINKPWKLTIKAIDTVIMKSREYGISSIDLIPSKNSLIPVFILYHKFGNKDINFDYVIYWLLLANYSERYSGASQYAIQKDVSEILNAKTFKNALVSLFKNIEEEKNISPILSVDSELIKNSKYKTSKGRFLRLLLYMMMFKKGSRDWDSGVRIGFDKGNLKQLQNFSPEWHHIYPQNILKRKGFKGEEINSVANITVITSGTNKKFKKEPWEYILEYKINNRMLREHFIPPSFKGWSPKIEKRELKKIWSIRNYHQFLEERSKFMAKEMNKYLKEISPTWLK